MHQVLLFFLFFFLIISLSPARFRVSEHSDLNKLGVIEHLTDPVLESPSNTNCHVKV